MVKLLLVLVLGVVAVLVVGALAFAAFGGSDDSDSGNTGASTPANTEPAAGADPDALLEASLAAAADVTSFHFVLTHENGSTPLPLNLALESAEGDILVPASIKADVDAEALGVNVSVDIIGIDGRTWVTNPFTRDWQELPGTNIRDFADPASLVESILPSITDARLGETRNIDGVETQQVTGTIDSGALQGALGIAVPGNSVTVEVWIGVDDDLPRRVRLTGALSEAEASNVVREVDLSRYNQPVEIMPPE